MQSLNWAKSIPPSTTSFRLNKPMVEIFFIGCFLLGILSVVVPLFYSPKKKQEGRDLIQEKLKAISACRRRMAELSAEYDNTVGFREKGKILREYNKLKEKIRLINIDKCYKKVSKGNKKVSIRFQFYFLAKKCVFSKKISKNLLQNEKKYGMIYKCMDELGLAPSHATPTRLL